MRMRFFIISALSLLLTGGCATSTYHDCIEIANGNSDSPPCWIKPGFSSKTGSIIVETVKHIRGWEHSKQTLIDLGIARLLRQKGMTAKVVAKVEEEIIDINGQIGKNIKIRTATEASLTETIEIQTRLKDYYFDIRTEKAYGWVVEIENKNGGQ